MATTYRFDGFNGEDGDGSEQYLSWISSLRNINFERLKPKAVKALERLISDDSELNQLWSETEQYTKWKEIYAQIIKRLR